MHGYHEITCHIIFDVNINLTRKDILLASGSKTEDKVALTYLSVVSWYNVQLAFLISALNDLYVMVCDIGNAYLNAPCK